MTSPSPTRALWLPFGPGVSILECIFLNYSLIMNASEHTILIVEDEELLLDLLREMLEAEGYRVLTATDGKEAVEVFRSHWKDVSLVLSDMGLPSMGGWEVLQELRVINPQVKVILSSGFMDPKVRQDVIKSGAHDFIQKPYVPENVVRQIRELILS
jgi:CheY-like chemotaxis protein